jgi:glutathione synthase/RimK-type ligase-like ATP-grasp enzyme
MKTRLVPYSKVSKGAKDLSEALTARLGYYVFRGEPRKNKINIGWGTREVGPGRKWLNHPDYIKNARNKIRAFALWKNKGVAHVPHTTSKENAQKWASEGYKVVARTADQQAGSGITVVEAYGIVPDMPLYTKYIPKKREFRVHVFQGKVILVQEKRRKKGVSADYTVRSNHRGWVFCIQDIKEPKELRNLGVAAVSALGLDFGAVDIIYNEKQDKLYALEVNTAPGIEKDSTCMEAYTNAICEAVE